MPPEPAAPVAPRLSRRRHDAVILDLDGVLTRTARLHARAWKELFDPFLRERSRREGVPFRPFDENSDYRAQVDGKPREDGVRDFLASRGISLPEGEPGDPPGAETVRELCRRKNRIFLMLLSREGVEPFPASVAFVRAARARGFRTAVVSSSRNCVPVLEAAGLRGLFDAKVDGVDASDRKLRGKPEPDLFHEAARALGVEPARAVVVEDAAAGVAAGRRGKFAMVVGVGGTDREEALREAGADAVVADLSRLAFDEEGSAAASPRGGAG